MDFPEPQAKIIITSDGTYESTKLYVNGQLVPVTRIFMTCHPASEYSSPSCDIEIDVMSESSNGLENTLTMRMRQPSKYKEDD